MEILKFDLNSSGNNFKILNATNGGPWHRRYANDQFRSNFADYKSARIPYSRNHDSAVCGIYGGPYSHDITYIFPDFDADPYDAESYDFACTDESILVCLDAGTETFFRLGQTIEHQIKKHGTVPPEDFKKWAVICEHIIRHYNEGWADGYKLNIKYWEIWNEADLDPDDSSNKRTWGGTKAEFFDLFEITTKHLKECFPDLKIGGPALAHNEEWAEDFLQEMQKRNVPLDFFSWHIYCTEPVHMAQKAERIKTLLNKYGYENSESILNEWNYVKGWTDEFLYTIKMIHGIKGAAFVMPSWKSLNPSGMSGPMLNRCFTDGDCGMASMMCLVITSSPAHTIILMSAALQRYTISFLVSKCVAGITTAPSLCKAMVQNQNSMRRFKISITMSPCPMPRLWK